MSVTSKLYHRKPLNMQGQLLFPLNLLQGISTEHYQKQRTKYVGRETLMAQRIPTLNCLWNDVIHLSPIHPEKLAACAQAAGLGWQQVEWFEIDPVDMGFNADNTAIFHYRDLDYGEQMDPAEFEPFEIGRLPALAAVRKSTGDYYRSIYQSGGSNARYLLFVGVPHILHRGVLNVETTPSVWA